MSFRSQKKQLLLDVITGLADKLKQVWCQPCWLLSGVFKLDLDHEPATATVVRDELFSLMCQVLAQHRRQRFCHMCYPPSQLCCSGIGRGGKLADQQRRCLPWGVELRPGQLAALTGLTYCRSVCCARRAVPCCVLCRCQTSRVCGSLRLWLPGRVRNPDQPPRRVSANEGSTGGWLWVGWHYVQQLTS